MVAKAEAHDVAVLAPWYAGPARKVAIHRYLDPGFVAQFQADVSSVPLDTSQLFAWEESDRMSAAAGSANVGRLKLRRPVHRTFHIIAWEASCKLATAPSGQPAIAPEKIAAAGFVLRDISISPPLGFQIVKGRPQGWAAVDPTADPDATLQVKSLGLVPRQLVPSPAYTGEETFPLHPLAVQSNGTPHTLLYGYLPIGGGDFVPPSVPAPDSGSVAETLPWPFGLSDYSSGAPAVYTADLQISGGALSPAMAALLAVLLGRYRLVDPAAWSDPVNARLISILGALNFFADPPAGLSLADLRSWAAANTLPGTTLGALLLGWVAQNPPGGSTLVTQQQSISAGQALLLTVMDQPPSDPAPPASAAYPFTPPAGAVLPTGYGNLLVSESAATQLRDALAQRSAQASTDASADLPVAKLLSGPAGQYAVVPFVRTVRPDGCAKLFWGTACDPFAVAAMFDPDAARPSLIEMPDLADAKKGLARGASFQLPPSLADLVTGLSSNSAAKGVLQGTPPAGGLGIGFICSFSLPAISICAMIALSIILSLLNIFLGWMAWVKICLPIPVPKKGP